MFSPELNKCTVGCILDPDDPPVPPCPEEDCDGCNRYDKTGTLWQASKGETIEKDCKLWDENYSGSQTWTCIEGPDGLNFSGDYPDRSDCEEGWIDDIGNQVNIDMFGLLW